MNQPATEADLMSFLDSIGIGVETHRHPPMFTVEESQALRGDMPGGHCKSLFVRDKKKRRALIVADEAQPVDLKALSAIIDMGRLSFGSADSLYDMLGVRPGSVTPFALINLQVEDGQEPPIKVVLDAKMLTHDVLHYHPLHNEATCAIVRDDLLKFIRACGYEPMITKLS